MESCLLLFVLYVRDNQQDDTIRFAKTRIIMHRAVCFPITHTRYSVLAVLSPLDTS